MTEEDIVWIEWEPEPPEEPEEGLNYPVLDYLGRYTTDFSSYGGHYLQFPLMRKIYPQ